MGAATLSLGLAIAPFVWAEMEVARDSRGRVYTVDMEWHYPSRGETITGIL
ncbi:MAG TPA: hypothetical protein IGP91_03520 [Thermosynechococcus sp. M46_R2017_013]|nr:hypothetical protein [Thermosynechococcus sp. M46_R2017_013]